PTHPPHPHSFPTRRSSDLALHFFHEIARQLIRANHFEKRQIGINAGGNNLAVKFIACLGSYSGCPAILQNDFGYSALGLYLHARSEEHTSELQSPYDLVCR